ncbi:Flp pilus assembly protein CpaB [Wenxinia saemankumensis]|uniref:Pilus assembly protein CpaB n=1 Tax=Wenxinia saemankumensis TaxID=1447782 RepID=A0A1M6GUW0_9RHOB|nr:Flp pilus assembly protein CpaB [Wenxinia saemankumensis]SHJ13753.1 pilus assembly protein CpaB [Wenxinia saemankumensis]
MRAVFGLVLLIGLGLAGFAVYMVQGHFAQQELALAQQRAQAAQRVPTVEVYALARDIAYGEEITPEDVKLVQYAEPFLPAGIFRTEEELFPRGTDVLRAVTQPMWANEPVLASRVTEPGVDAGIETRLSPGMRAFAISVNATSGVSGHLRTGNRVDVYWTGRPPGNSTSEVTKLIETSLPIIAVDQSSDTTREVSLADTVTVEVTPQQVAQLRQAQATGSLALSLIGQRDETIASAIEVDQRSLLGIVEQAPVVEEAPDMPEVCTTRVRRGSEVVDIPIPCN